MLSFGAVLLILNDGFACELNDAVVKEHVHYGLRDPVRNMLNPYAFARTMIALCDSGKRYKAEVAPGKLSW